MTNAQRLICVYPASDILIENNYIYDSIEDQYIYGIHVEPHADFATENITIRNNVIWNIIRPGYLGSGITAGYAQPYGVSNIHISNNTIYNVSENGILLGSGYENRIVTNFLVNNNIIVHTEDTGLELADPDKGVADYNCVFDSP